MASGVVEANWLLAHPRFARRLSFCRSGPDCLAFGRHMAERQVGRSDTLDVLDVWIYGCGISQRSIARGYIDCDAQLHARCRDGRGRESASVIFPGGISSCGAANFRLESRSIWRWRTWPVAPLASGAIQVGQSLESLNERAAGIKHHSARSPDNITPRIWNLGRFPERRLWTIDLAAIPRYHDECCGFSCSESSSRSSSVA
jgi:hypothetical protein